MDMIALRERLKGNPIIAPFVDARRRLIARKNENLRRRLEALIRYRDEDASRLIFEAVTGGAPALVGRFGSCEIGLIAEFRKNPRLTGILEHPLAQILFKMGGVYPETAETIRRFCEINLSAMGDIDVLGSWCVEELLFKQELGASRRVPLGNLEPYSTSRPWTAGLEGRRVLVVNPLAETIQRQYKKRAALFGDPAVLPEFELSVYKAVYEFSSSDRKFESWFEALETMRRDILAMSFDVAVLGCGPFGVPLAASIKRSGRTAVILGGATQVWFGIRGGRWDQMPFFQRLYNESWTYPSDSETPAGSGALEGSCYWKPKSDGAGADAER